VGNSTEYFTIIYRLLSSLGGLTAVAGSAKGEVEVEAERADPVSCLFDRRSLDAEEKLHIA